MLYASGAQAFDESYRANPRYDHMVREASKHQSDNFRFGIFRSYYKDTRQYDPLAEELIDKMFEYSYIVQNDPDEDKASQALESYQALVLDHLANLQVVAQVLSLSKIDQRFGNPEFFTWMMRGLIADVKRSGNGDTLQDAYDVITLAEENVLFGQLGVKRIETKAAQEGFYHYNMHEVKDIRTGQSRTVFVNTTIPMRFLEKKQKAAATTLSMPRQ